ncbi:iron ABC transporter ATP-binding protein [Pilimelia terevasa]|uniref:Iron ABC transporter ATP-binding protein n=1 Tax=Pilimelia terevasa TaxID=53372 RepID=A0A8J3BG80_9ACTN|nr:ATP-binding cassette domain-containing protein [Pilimelia terevasa]GGK19253.1 iron ABC transporter ATP-binding protein [Pilimelia terevasa]
MPNAAAEPLVTAPAPAEPPDPPAPCAADEAAVALCGVRVTRGDAVLLEAVDWQVDPAERWVVLGPNGAGKTTLLQLAAGRMHPSGGTVTLLGERLGATDVGALRARIGLTSAADRLPDRERVHDVVLTAAWSVVGRFRERYEALDDARAAALLAQLGVGGLADRSYGTLSEGERKRVQIARALMTDPELLLLDEPAAGLDLAGRERLVERLAALAADPAAPTMVLVTHHVEEIPPGFTHALVLRGGAVVARGPLAETVTAETLSAAFALPLEVRRVGERFTAAAAG